MNEKVTSGTEKIFLLHIINDDPNQFFKVEPYFFKNDDIQFIYKVIRDEYLISTKKIVPTTQQIFAMIRMNDPEKKISDAMIKTILKGDNSEYDSNWIEPRFKAWKLSNLVKNNTMKTIEYVRGIDEVNYDNVVDITNKIKNMMGEINLIDDDDKDLGEDFDDPDSHKINETNKKMSSGWPTMDRVLGGGWDQASMVVIMAQSSGGKCFFDTYLKIKNKKTGLIENVKVEDFFERIKKRLP